MALAALAVLHFAAPAAAQGALPPPAVTACATYALLLTLGPYVAAFIIAVALALGMFVRQIPLITIMVAILFGLVVLLFGQLLDALGIQSVCAGVPGPSLLPIPAIEHFLCDDVAALQHLAPYILMLAVAAALAMGQIFRHKSLMSDLAIALVVALVLIDLPSFLALAGLQPACPAPP